MFNPILFILQPGATFLLATINWWSDWSRLIFLIRSNSGLFCSNNLKILFFLQTITSLEVNWKVSKWWFIREAVGFPLYFSFSGWWVVVVVVVVVVQAVLSLSPGEHNTLPPLILTRPAGRSLAGRWGQWPSYWSTCNSRYSIDIVFSPNLINHHHHHYHHHYHPTDSPELQPFLGFPAEIIFSSHYEELEGN